ncbi:MaoC family dehydratase [Nocardia sp. NPDC049190]|uniref:MaoC family dehydratase n=1 Tax=Nocardia sp. NPDC049190 TaxID=3155650 RepID=UPI0033ECF7C3
METLRTALGADLGVSGWIEIGQERIDAFAAATGDHQWIHVDRERAADGPYGTTIAHGYLTLSLLPSIIGEVFRIDGAAARINYGVNKVRFPSPVPSGARIRGRATIVRVEDVPGGLQAVLAVTVDREGTDKPVCVAETIVRALA